MVVASKDMILLLSVHDLPWWLLVKYVLPMWPWPWLCLFKVIQYLMFTSAFMFVLSGGSVDLFQLCCMRERWWSSGKAVGLRSKGSIPSLATWISEIGYIVTIVSPASKSHMAEILLKQCKSSIQPTNQTIMLRLCKPVISSLVVSCFCLPWH